MEAHNGTRFGAFGEPFEVDRTCCTVSSDGCIFTCSTVSLRPDPRGDITHSRRHCEDRNRLRARISPHGAQ